MIKQDPEANKRQAESPIPSNLQSLRAEIDMILAEIALEKLTWSQGLERIMQTVTQHAISELEALLNQVPMPTLSYEQVEKRIADLKAQQPAGSST